MTNIQVENLSETKKKVTFEVPRDKYIRTLDAEYRDLKKNTQIKGFRKGKVPISILRSYFREKVEADVAKKLIEETFEPALESEKIVPVSIIKIEPSAVEGDKPFQYTAEIEVPPPVEVKDYKGLKLTKRTIDEASVEEQVRARLRNLQERHARLVPISEDREIKQGDHLVVDIEASHEGEKLTRLTVVDHHMEIGREFYIPGFDSKLEGIRPNETKDLTMELPESFPRKDVAGKTVQFRVTVKDAKERVIPGLDDDFAKDLGKYETIEQVEKTIREDQRNLQDRAIRRELEEQVIDRLVEMHPIDVPQAMIEKQIDTDLERVRDSLVGMGMDPEEVPAPTAEQREQARPHAERTVKAALIFRAILDKEQIQISDEDAQKEIERRAHLLEVSPDHYKDLFERDDKLDDVRFTLRERRVFDLIIDNAEITEEQPTPKEGSPHEEPEEE